MLWVRRSVFFSSSPMRPVNVGSNHRPSLSIPMTGSNITWQNDSFRGILPNRNGELHRHYGYVKRTQVIDEAGTEDMCYDYHVSWIFPIGEGVRTTTEQKKKPAKKTPKEIQKGNGKDKPTKRRCELVLCFDCIQCYLMFDVNT